MKGKIANVLLLLMLVPSMGYSETVGLCVSHNLDVICAQSAIALVEGEDFFANLLDTSKWPSRWECGTWTDFHGWLYILSDVGIWLAYFAIPLILGIFLYKKKNAGLPFPGVLLLFITFILSCGLTHLVDAVIFWAPVYKLSAVIRFITAVVSMGTVFALIRVAPKVMQFKSPEELELEVHDRTEALEKLNHDLAMEVRDKETARMESRLLLESLPLITWVADVNGESTYVNSRWKEYTGFDYNDDETWNKVVHPDDLQPGIDLWRHCLRTGDDYVLEQRLAAKDGHYEWFLVKAIAIKDEHGNIMKWIGTDTNIDEQKRSESKKDTFLNIASHELKTPLTSIKAYLELLKEILGDYKFEPVPTYLNKAYKSTQKLNNLIAELLDVSRIQSGKFTLNKTAFDLDEMVQEIIEIFQHDNPTHEIIFDGHINGNIIADKGRIEQVVSNLLSNAIKYSPKADKVIIRTSREAEFAQVDVVDFGTGIKKEEHGKLFEQFYRSQDTARSANGLGMGLYISKEIARQHKGIIKIHSVEGQGSTFTLILPVTAER